MKPISWTSDDLSTPVSHQILAITAREHDRSYQLIRDTEPDRWYIIRRWGPNVERTIVYTSRNAPGLQSAWKLITEGKAR